LPEAIGNPWISVSAGKKGEVGGILPKKKRPALAVGVEKKELANTPFDGRKGKPSTGERVNRDKLGGDPFSKKANQKRP